MTNPKFQLDLSLVSGEQRLESDRMALLHSIHKKGTLTEAAKEIGISYKTACAWLEALNNAAEEPLLTASHGGNTRGGTVLTELGRAYLERYERMVELHARMQAELENTGDLSAFLQRLRLRTSARNHLHGTVLAITGDKVRCVVNVQISPAICVQANVSREAVHEMGLAEGVRVACVFKAAAVLLEPYQTGTLQRENSWKGEVLRVLSDGESVEIVMDIDGQHTISALVDQERWEGIKAVENSKAIALINPSHVLLIRME